MTTVQQLIRNCSRLPNRLHFLTEDGTELMLYRRPLVAIGKDTVTWVWTSEHKDIQVGFTIRQNKQHDESHHQTRFVGIVSQNGVVPPDVGVALAEVFLPNIPGEMRWEKFGTPGNEWPHPVLMACNSRRAAAALQLSEMPGVN